MLRGAELFPGHAASPVPCGRTDFHGYAPSFTVGSSQPFSVETDKAIQTTSRGPEWWKRSKLTTEDSRWGHSTLNRRILVLNNNAFVGITTVLHSAPNTHQSNVPNQNTNTGTFNKRLVN
jgi:hypothetical protein